MARPFIPDDAPIGKGHNCYFAGAFDFQDGGLRLIKIGYSKQVAFRIGQLSSCAGPCVVRLMASDEGGREQERVYLKKFAEHCVGGEWFEPHPDILAEIERLNAPRLPMRTPLPGKQEQQP